MVTHKTIRLSPKQYGIHLITNELFDQIELNGSGLVHIFIQHTSAALALNEHASPDVLEDMQQFFNRLVPEDGPYKHTEEGADDMPAHIKSVLCGTSLSIPFQDNRLLLGVWQGIYLLEFRYKASSRSIVVSQLI